MGYKIYVALNAVETFTCTAETAENITATDYNTNLYTSSKGCLDLFCILVEYRTVPRRRRNREEGEDR